MCAIKIRNVQIEDLESILKIIKDTFPIAEGANAEKIRFRMDEFSQWFFVVEEERKVVGFIIGRPFNKEYIFDELYGAEKLEVGNNLAILTVATLPERQHHRISTHVIKYFLERAKEKEVEAIVLACKKELITFYESFGFTNLGISGSSHGGSTWYDMIFKNNNKKHSV